MPGDLESQGDVPAGPESYEKLPDQRQQGNGALTSVHTSMQSVRGRHSHEPAEVHHDRNPSHALDTPTQSEIEGAAELCDHVHHSNRAPWLRALVLGASDGLVSTSALMVGVAGGTDALGTLRLAGVAGLVGGALSMAVGEYISVASQRDAEHADIEKERQEQLKGPEARAHELEELTLIYVDRGLPYDLAKQVAVVLTEKDVIRAHARDELGIDLDDLANPLQAALVSGVFFTTGGGLPLLSAAFITDYAVRLGVLLTVSMLGLLAFGMLGAWLGGASMVRGGARVVVGGAVSLAIVFGIGRALGAQV